MGTLVLALGLVFVVEGLALALAPSRVEDILALLSRLPVEARRLIGGLAVVAGAALIALSGG